VGLPDAILFLRISRVGVFQQPRDLTSTTVVEPALGLKVICLRRRSCGLATLKAGTALTVLLDRSGQAELDQQRLKTRVGAQAVEIDGCRMLAEFTTGVVPAFKCEARS
jgi:uncharacterized protein (UPF0371 family)